MISRADLALLLVSLIWASTFVIVKEALAEVSTLLFLALRFTLASIMLALILGRRLLSGQPYKWRHGWRGGLVCSTFLFLGYALQTAGLRLTSASRSAFLTGLYIVLVPLLASFVNQGRPQRREFGGALLALAGTALMTSDGGGWRLQRFDLSRGDLLTLGCAFAFAAHILAVAHYSRKMSSERLSLFQIGGVALFCWAAIGPFEKPEIAWSTGLAWALASTAILATTFCFFIYTWAQRRTTAARAALIFATEPVFAGLVAWGWAGEHWTVASLAGAGLILSGIVLVEMKPAAPAGHQLH